MHLLFVLTFVPVLFFLLVWVAVTAYRIYFPDRPIPFEEDELLRRRRWHRKGNHLSIGLREIREDQRRQFRRKEQASHYHVGCGPEGIPRDWKENLWQRRN